METKECRVCFNTKNISEFSNCIKSYGTFKRSYCKECGRKQRRDWHKNRKDGFWYIYYLPEEHYIGMTSLISERLKAHDRKGKIIDNYEIIGKYSNPALALMHEALFHYCGYEGCVYR
jgi:hypothetical protein